MRYFDPDPATRPDEAGYHIEDGIVVDDTEVRVRDFDALTRYHYPSEMERRAEEARWAAKSGPVTVRRLRREVA